MTEEVTSATNVATIDTSSTSTTNVPAPSLNNPLLGDINSSAEGQKSEADWFIGPEIPGSGDKPDWFNNKQFKTIFDQAKSQADTRKMLGQRTGAPDEYNFNLDQLGKDYEGLEIDKDDPLLAEFSKFAKEEKLSQEGFNGVLKMFVDYSNMQNTKEAEQLAEFQREELETLGGPDQAKQQIGEMTQWFKQNFPDFQPEDFQDMMYFAGGVKILKAMRDKMRYAPVPSSTSDNMSDSIDADQLKQMIGDKRYETDPVYQKKVDELYQRKYG